MLAVGIALVVLAVLISLLGAIWVGVPALFAGLILLGVALIRGLRGAETGAESAEPPAR